MNPYITIIMPIYNGAKYINYMLASLKDQTFDDFQLVIVNDASLDDSENIIMQHLNDFRYPIKYFVLDKHLGAGFARNYAINMVKTKLMCFLDCDDTVEPSFLESFVIKYQKSKYDFCFCDYDVINDDTGSIRITGQMPHKNNLTSLKKAYFCNKIRICHCCTMFDSNFFIGKKLSYNVNSIIAEDTELICKAVFLAKNVVEIKDILYHYHEHASLLHRTPDESYLTAYPALIEASKYATNLFWKLYFKKTRITVLHKFLIDAYNSAGLAVPLYCSLNKIKFSLLFGGPLLRNKESYKQLLKNIKQKQIVFKNE